MKRLIVTADDFGYSKNANRAIIKCFRKGIVTSTSLLANTKYFGESIRLLKLNKNLDVGLHINLTEFKPLTKAETLADAEGNFIGKEKWIKEHFRNVDENYIEEELEAQINKVISSGLKITHINGHNHIHVFPKVIDAVLKLAKKHKIKYVRMPYEKNIRLHKKGIASVISKFLKPARSKMLKNKLKATDAFYGILNMHDMHFSKLSEILSTIGNGTSELMVHPAYINKKGDVFHQSKQRENEIRLLTSKKTMQAIKNLKIMLTNFSQL